MICRIAETTRFRKCFFTYNSVKIYDEVEKPALQDLSLKSSLSAIVIQ
ncbi:MAG: hypothetical protein UW91_C0024G0009 [Parcubacteria group bacterium GW2011_GWF2_45_11]|nr:MAG: hypothetical protein UW91_C0024G0009 [Parcubacteria group bacterium GW2011_GWF2_45_11]